MRILSRLVVSLVMGGAMAFVASPAFAANANADFGHHVHHCVHHMGFDGEHNPGMHQGKSGWDPAHVC
ncbi:MAG: hypothetical protein WAS07_11720 [Micropruina sp.]